MMRATVAAQFTPWACLLLCCALTALTAAAAPQTPDQAPSVEQQSRICMVIRTFWGHGGDTALQQKQGLRRMLSSLRQQSNPNWEAILVVMDSEPFRDMQYILQELNDERIWVFAEWVGKEYTPKLEGRWTAGYHEKLYNLTDEAIRACPADTEWVAVSNGDNDYAKSFFSRIEAIKDADLIAFNFYSRYQRTTGVPCERFGQQEGAPICKVNRLRWCHTDLGANVMRWPRLVAEDRRFGALNALTHGLAAEHFDGIMAQALVADWPVEHVHDCLYDHSPTPQSCARLGGIWDDSDMAPSNIGGRCLNSWQASKRLKDGRGGVEEVVVDLSHDANLAGFEGGDTEGAASVRCLRQQDAGRQRHELMAYFGEACADDFDLPSFQDTAYIKAAEEISKQIEEAAAAEAAARKAAMPQPPGPPETNDTSGTAVFRELVAAA